MAQVLRLKSLFLLGFENDDELPVAVLPLSVPSSLLTVNVHLSHPTRIKLYDEDCTILIRRFINSNPLGGNRMSFFSNLIIW